MIPGTLLLVLLAQFYILQTTQLGYNEMDIIRFLKSQYHIQLSYHVKSEKQKKMNFHLKEILKYKVWKPCLKASNNCVIHSTKILALRLFPVQFLDITDNGTGQEWSWILIHII